MHNVDCKRVFAVSSSSDDDDDDTNVADKLQKKEKVEHNTITFNCKNKNKSGMTEKEDESTGKN